MRLFLFMLLVLVRFTVSAQPGKPAEADLDRLNFWVGEWKVSWSGGSGINRIEKTLNDRVIVEHFEITEGQTKGFQGTSISTFNPENGKWHQAWADNQGGYFNFLGESDGENWIFKTPESQKGANGNSYIFRMRFYRITHQAFDWDWERSSDGGKTWELRWQIHYERKNG